VATGRLAHIEPLAGHTGRGVHHIAGAGLDVEGATIAVLAETVERYAQYAAAAALQPRIVYAPARAMAAGADAIVVLRRFSEEQLARRGFPFAALSADDPIGWVPAIALPRGSLCWLPAQDALLGYQPRESEPRFTFGVSTGTAVHTTPQLATASCLLELIQIDAAMGNWFGDRRPRALDLEGSERTRAVAALVRRHLRPGGPVPRFYWLPSPDLPGLAIAAVIEAAEPPVAVVGLGCAPDLEPAVLKAFLEANAVARHARLLAPMARPPAAPDALYDLDANVAHYAAEMRTTFRERFASGPEVDADDLPADAGDVDLVGAFAATGKRLAFVDLTTPDVAALGLHAVRIWSPDTLVLSLPSAPPVMHPRWTAYGGVRNSAPHPYP
jgi:thiazole/oxazole-forming peptide maturase SagD family component